MFAAITFGGQALGRASALTPDVGKAKMAAAKLFDLFDRKPIPDSSDPDGLQPVSMPFWVSFSVYQDYWYFDGERTQN